MTTIDVKPDLLNFLSQMAVTAIPGIIIIAVVFIIFRYLKNKKS